MVRRPWLRRMRLLAGPPTASLSPDPGLPPGEPFPGEPFADEPLPGALLPGEPLPVTLGVAGRGVARVRGAGFFSATAARTASRGSGGGAIPTAS